MERRGISVVCVYSVAFLSFGGDSFFVPALGSACAAVSAMCFYVWSVWWPIATKTA